MRDALYRVNCQQAAAAADGGGCLRPLASARNPDERSMAREEQGRQRRPCDGKPSASGDVEEHVDNVDM